MGFQTGHTLRPQKSQWPDLPQLVSQGLLCGLKHCMRFPAKPLISQLPTALFFFCSWGNRKPKHLALCYKPCLILPSRSCDGTVLLVNCHLQAWLLHGPSKDGLPHLLLILQVAVPAGPRPMSSHEPRYQPFDSSRSMQFFTTSGPSLMVKLQRALWATFCMVL